MSRFILFIHRSTVFTSFDASVILLQKISIKQYHPEFNFAPNILHNALHIGTFERAINVNTTEDYIILSVCYGKFNIAVEIVRNKNDKNLPTSPIRKITITDINNDFNAIINYSTQSVNFTFRKNIIKNDASGDLLLEFQQHMSQEEYYTNKNTKSKSSIE